MFKGLLVPGPSGNTKIVYYYTIIMSRTLKVTGNHVMYDRGAWFLKVIISSSLPLFYLPSVKKHKQWLVLFRSKFGFCDNQNNQGLGKCYQPQPSASADNPYLDLDYLSLTQPEFQCVYTKSRYNETKTKQELKFTLDATRRESEWKPSNSPAKKKTYGLNFQWQMI